jgi:hypothetical protein
LPAGVPIIDEPNAIVTTVDQGTAVGSGMATPKGPMAST